MDAEIKDTDMAVRDEYLHRFFCIIIFCLHMFIFQSSMSGVHGILILSNHFLHAGDCCYDS